MDERSKKPWEEILRGKLSEKLVERSAECMKEAARLDNLHSVIGIELSGSMSSDLISAAATAVREHIDAVTTSAQEMVERWNRDDAHFWVEMTDGESRSPTLSPKSDAIMRRARKEGWVIEHIRLDRLEAEDFIGQPIVEAPDFINYAKDVGINPDVKRYFELGPEPSSLDERDVLPFPSPWLSSPLFAFCMERRASGLTVATNGVIHLGRDFVSDPENDRKIMALHDQRFAEPKNLPTATIQVTSRVEAPCRQCARNNDIGSKKCWWCEVSGPLEPA